MQALERDINTEFKLFPTLFSYKFVYLCFFSTRFNSSNCLNHCARCRVQWSSVCHICHQVCQVFLSACRYYLISGWVLKRIRWMKSCCLLQGNPFSPDPAHVTCGSTGRNVEAPGICGLYSSTGVCKYSQTSADNNF